MKRFILCLFVCLAGCSQLTTSYGRYSIGRDQSWYPLNLGREAISITAFTNALVSSIAEKENVPMKIIDIDWLSLFQDLEERRVAGVFSSIPPNLENSSKYSFSEPFLLLGPVLVVPKDSSYTSLDQMDGKFIGINQFDDSILIVQKNPTLLPKLYQNMPKALDDLVAGKIDGVLLANLEAHALVPSRYKEKLKIVTPPLNNEGLRLVTLKGKNKRLIKLFNKGLEAFKKSSHYRALREEFNIN